MSQDGEQQGTPGWSGEESVRTLHSRLPELNLMTEASQKKEFSHRKQVKAEQVLAE